MTTIISCAPAQNAQLELLSEDNEVVLSVMWHTQKGHDRYGAVDGKLDGACEALRSNIVDLDIVDFGDEKVALIGTEKVSDGGVRDPSGLLSGDDIVVHD